MQEVSRQQVMDSLKAAGISRGDGLLVHSALQFLGRPSDGVGMYLEALDEVIRFFNSEGRVAVPTFNFSFARGQDYNPATAPSIGMGAFSELVRLDPRSHRTTHPMQSFALIGARAEELASLDTPSAFDDGSAVDKMLEMDDKLLLLGANIQAVSALHYSEQRTGVPYRYWKDFHGNILRNGEWQPVCYRMYVRDMQIDAKLEIFEIESVMKQRGLWREVPLNYGKIATCRLRDFVDITTELLKADPWRFVTNKPEEAG
ncbi:MAG: AAC(3) family N-acetyltransferase [Anaerolineales bacterium]|nr:AAC(3) family N-acetyltransferase [Anaerolineales bacterium]